MSAKKLKNNFYLVNCMGCIYAYKYSGKKNIVKLFLTLRKIGNYYEVFDDPSITTIVETTIKDLYDNYKVTECDPEKFMDEWFTEII